jgi:hypothetical protein
MTLAAELTSVECMHQRYATVLFCTRLIVLRKLLFVRQQDVHPEVAVLETRHREALRESNAHGVLLFNPRVFATMTLAAEHTSDECMQQRYAIDLFGCKDGSRAFLHQLYALFLCYKPLSLKDRRL